MKAPVSGRVLLLAALAAASLAASGQARAQAPAVVAHRGASGYVPEETVNAFDLAVQMGADYIESDAQLTKDGVPVLLHDATLNATTNVVDYASTHSDIYNAGTVSGSTRLYYVANLTLAQVKQLTATNRAAAGFGTGTTTYKPSQPYTVATLGDMLDYAFNLYRTTGKAIGIYVEAKQEGLAVADAMLAVFNSPKYRGLFANNPSRVVLESFYPDTLTYLHGKTNFPLIQLLNTCPTSAATMSQYASYAQYIGPLFTTRTGSGTSAPAATDLAAATNCVQLAHGYGLKVVPYTFYDYAGDYTGYYNTGIDGLFTNFTDIAVNARSQLFPSN